MITVSLCMIVKNEEEVLERCLRSAEGIADEIIIADTGSTDGTKEIAAKFTDGIYDFKWRDDFAAARNFAFSKAEGDYCMWLDADDVIEPEEREKLLRLKGELSPNTDVVMMKYNIAFDQEGRPTFSYFRERWIKNNGAFKWQGAVHEAIAPAGKVVYSDIAISNKRTGEGDPDRNLRIYGKMISEGKTLNPREKYYFGRELYYHGLYEEAVSVFDEFLNEPEGWVENKIEACSVCAKCYFGLERDKEGLLSLFKSFLYDSPRAEICCDIGKYFLEKSLWRQAAHWYKAALKSEKGKDRQGFVLPDCYDYIPYIELCVCYYRMGEHKKARAYNEAAGRCKPYSEAYIYNKAYFENLKD